MVVAHALYPRRVLITVAVVACFVNFYILSRLSLFPFQELKISTLSSGDDRSPTSFAPIKDSLLNKTLGDGDFGELGRWIQLLTEYTAKADEIAKSYRRRKDVALLTEVEDLTVYMFPWLRHSSSNDPMPFRSLRQTFIPASRGIIIPTGKDQFRFTAHLITSLRHVINSSTPIQIAYAGDNDLPQRYRQALLSLGSNIELLDVTNVFDGVVLELENTWAIKPFAMLASSFEQAILLDADTVLLQDPAIAFDYPAYTETGTYMFHDRLLWQHAYPERHNWWKTQLAGHNATKSLLRSKVYMEDYAEEQDSGMVVMDKRRLEIVTSLLHICWQNTPAVREEYTYLYTYGDKESWWFGLELCGVEYAFEKNYGSIAGEKVTDAYLGDKVCSFTIAHPDGADEDNRKLLWYNGSLLKNKAMNTTEYAIPQYWMTDATWWKGATKPDMSCMVGGEIKAIDMQQVRVLEQNVEAARSFDDKFSNLLEL